MRCKPRLDVAAPFRRQLAVDVSMQLVFGDGNIGIGHCRLCPVLIKNCKKPTRLNLTLPKTDVPSVQPLPCMTPAIALPSFHPPQCGALALKRRFHMSPRAGKPGIYRTDRDALNTADPPVTQPFRH